MVVENKYAAVPCLMKPLLAPALAAAVYLATELSSQQGLPKWVRATYTLLYAWKWNKYPERAGWWDGSAAF